MGNEGRFKPVQPYLIMDTCDYAQRQSALPDVSHFYTFSLKAGDKVRLVPDGCIDLYVAYFDGGTDVCVIDEKLVYKEVFCEQDCRIFGVRFMPGVLPKMLVRKGFRVSKEFAKFIPWNGDDEQWMKNMALERNFEKQVVLFTDWYNSFGPRDNVAKEVMTLIHSEIDLIIKSGGKIRIEELGEQIGYSHRYITRVTNQVLGYAPKVLCKIIQFQRALEYLDYGYPDNMTEVAVALGYYDQPQFIKDFSTCAGMTPQRYYGYMEEHHYKSIMDQITKEGE